jgi:tRNA-binding protein
LIDFDDFLKVDIRVGRVTRVEDFPEARKPAWKLFIDFGPELGEKRSSAQIKNYPREDLAGSLVVAVVNFPPRQIGPFISEVLTLGVPDEDGNVILLRPTEDVPVGGRVFWAQTRARRWLGGFASRPAHASGWARRYTRTCSAGPLRRSSTARSYSAFYTATRPIRVHPRWHCGSWARCTGWC